MGVDISGRNPIHRTPKHDYPNWNEISDKEKDEWFEMDEKWHNENPGDYFRSNWWGWRPIVMLCEYADSKCDLNIDFTSWGSNDGAGLRTQEECDKLASALEFVLLTNSELEEDTDTIYLNLGSWTSMDGKFLGKEINEELNEQYPYGTILYGSVVMNDGKIVQPSHSAPLRHVKKFISFLKECGGFEIW